MLQAALVAAVPGGGLAVSELAYGADDELLAFKVTTDAPLDREAIRQVRETVKGIFAGTKWADVPVVLCQKGLDIQLIKRSDADN